MMQRTSFKHDGLTLSYLDSGGDRPLIVALHALMAQRRPNSQLATLKAGHVIHHDDLPGFVAQVRKFLGAP